MPEPTIREKIDRLYALTDLWDGSEENIGRVRNMQAPTGILPEEMRQVGIGRRHAFLGYMMLLQAYDLMHIELSRNERDIIAKVHSIIEGLYQDTTSLRKGYITYSAYVQQQIEQLHSTPDKSNVYLYIFRIFGS